MSLAKTTTDHVTIRGWVESHGGRPSRVTTAVGGASIGGQVVAAESPA